MELLLPKRFLALLVVLAALAGAMYLADGQRRAAVMDTVWGLADRVAALIVPGEVEEAAMVGAGGQAGGLARSVATATFTPPVMPAAVFEREQARERTPTATPTATATLTPAPTPTPPPTPEPEAVGTPEVRIEAKGGDILVTALVPPVRRTWYEFDAVRGRWEKQTALLVDAVDMETVALYAIALLDEQEDTATAVSDPDVDLRAVEGYSVREEISRVNGYVLHITVPAAPLAARRRYLIAFQARTGGTPWTEPQTLSEHIIVEWR